jgi:hypothetical protein
MPEFSILLNGAPVTKDVVITSNAFSNAKLTVVHKNSDRAVGKLVQIECSSLLYISAVNGNLDQHGAFSFTVGPGFGLRGSVTLTISAGSGQKQTVNVQFV